MVLRATEMVQGKAIMEKGSWSTTQPQSRVGKLTGPLPAMVCPSLVWAPDSGPGGRDCTAATTGERTQDVVAGSLGYC